MKKTIKGFTKYPIWIVFVTNFVSLSVYFAGLYLLYSLWPPLTFLFLIYILYLEVSLYKEGCVHCFYFGKICAFGKGKIAGTFFKKGDPKKFCEKTVNFKDFIPQILASLIPVIAGIYLLFKDFNFLIFGATLWPVLIWIFGNQIIYGKLACPNCQQAQICCPVCEFFLKKSKKRDKKDEDH